jgi:hypothetical protein
VTLLRCPYIHRRPGAEIRFSNENSWRTRMHRHRCRTFKALQALLRRRTDAPRKSLAAKQLLGSARAGVRSKGPASARRQALHRHYLAMIRVVVDRCDARDLRAAQAAELGASATRERCESDANIGAVRPSSSIKTHSDPGARLPHPSRCSEVIARTQAVSPADP